MAEVKDIIKNLTEKAGKLGSLSREASENIARIAARAKEVSKTQEAGKAPLYPKK